MSLYYTTDSRCIIPKSVTVDDFIDFVRDTFGEELSSVAIDPSSQDFVWKFSCDSYLLEDSRFDSVVIQDVKFERANLIRFGRQDGNSIYADLEFTDVLKCLGNITEEKINPIECEKYASSWLFEGPVDALTELSATNKIFPKPGKPLWCLATHVETVVPLMRKSHSLIARNDFFRSLPKVLMGLPECVEKSIESILAALRFESQRGSSITNLLTEDKVRELFDCLKSQLNIEEIIDKDGLLKQARSLLTRTNQTAEELMDMVDLIDQYLLSLRPLNLSTLVSRLRELSVFGDMLAGRDVILLVGPARSGCTSAVHYLCQSSFTKKTIGGVDHFEPCSSDLLNSFVVSSSAEIQTNSANTANFVPLPNHPGHLVVCDCPAIGSADSALEDITRCVELARNLRLCASVRPVLVMSREALTGDATTVLDMFDGIMQLFPDIQFSQCSYIFTKLVPDVQSGEWLHERFLSLQKELSVSDSARLGEALQDAALKTQHDPFILDLTSGEKNHDYLINNLVQRAAVAAPASSARDFASSHGMETLTRQLDATALSFEIALKKGNWSLASFRLNQLADVREEVLVSRTAEAYQRAVGSLFDYISDLTQEVDAMLARVQQFTMNFESDVNELLDVMCQLSALESMRLRHCGSLLGRPVPDISLFDKNVQTLQTLQNQLLRDANPCDDDFAVKFRQLDLLMTAVDKRYHSSEMSLITKSIKLVQKSLQGSVNKISSNDIVEQMNVNVQKVVPSIVVHLNKSADALNSALQQLDYVQASAALTQLAKIRNNFEQLGNYFDCDVEEKIKAGVAALDATIAADCATCDDLFHTADMKNVSEIHLRLTRVVLAQGILNSWRQQICEKNSEHVRSLLKSMISCVAQWQNEFFDRFDASLDSLAVLPFEFASTTLQFLVSVRSLESIKSSTEAEFNDLVSIVRELIVALWEDITKYWIYMGDDEASDCLALLGQASRLAETDLPMKLYDGECVTILNHWVLEVERYDRDDLNALTIQNEPLLFRKMVDQFRFCTRFLFWLDSADSSTALVVKCREYCARVEAIINDCMTTAKANTKLSTSKLFIVPAKCREIFQAVDFYQVCAEVFSTHSFDSNIAYPYPRERQMTDAWKTQNELKRIAEDFDLHFANLHEIIDEQLEQIESDETSSRKRLTLVTQLKSAVQYLSGYADVKTVATELHLHVLPLAAQENVHARDSIQKLQRDLKANIEKANDSGVPLPEECDYSADCVALDEFITSSKPEDSFKFLVTLGAQN